MISVLLCSYNGEKYIEKQLESILEQTILPDEVIIQDDCSKDRTVSICENFIDSHNLNWTIIKNTENLGYRLNFITGIKKTSGDIVFLCDQDDIWGNKKIEIMSKLMKKDSIKSLASTYDLIDEEDNVVKKHMKHPYRNINGIRKIKTKEFYRFPQYLGMTMAIKRDVIDAVDLDYADVVTHDVFLNYYAARVNGLYFLDKALTKRRSIGTNTSQMVKEKQLNEQYKNDRLRIASNILNTLNLFQTLDEKNNLKKDENLENEIKIQDRRVEYLKSGNKTQLLKSMCTICKNSGVKTYIKDLLEVIKGA